MIIRWFFVCLAGLFAGVNLWAEGATTPRMVEVEARFVEATEAQMNAAYLALNAANPAHSAEPPAGIDWHPEPEGIFAILGIFTGEQTRKILDGLKSQKARVVSNPRVVTLSGHRARVENVRELRYPTEFSNPTKEPGRTVPTAFETKNVGITLEVEPNLQPGGEIHLRVSPSIVTFLGFIDYSSGEPGLDFAKPTLAEEILKRPLKGGGVWQPVFKTRQLTTEVTLYSGQTILMAARWGDPDAKKTQARAAQYFAFITAREVPGK